MEYFVLKGTDDPTAVFIDSPAEEYPMDYRLREGHKLADEWPSDATYFFSAAAPEGMVLTDAIMNPMGLLMVSNTLRELLLTFELKGLVEFLPIVIKNHKKRLATKEYSLANSVQLTSAVDRKESTFKVSSLDENQLRRIDKLVLRPEITTSGPPVLRLAENPMYHLFREDVVAAIKGANLTGMTFVSAPEFKTHG
jgi:hypothetical protein